MCFFLVVFEYASTDKKFSLELRPSSIYYIGYLVPTVIYVEYPAIGVNSLFPARLSEETIHVNIISFCIFYNHLHIICSTSCK